MKTDTIFKLGVCIELTLFLRKLFLFHDKNKSVKYNVIVKYFNNFSRYCIKPPWCTIHGYDKKMHLFCGLHSIKSNGSSD